MDPLLLGILAYVAVQIGIGIWVSRRIRTEDDYLLAGRRMGPWLATGTIFATWFGAETCVGAAGDAYEHGITFAMAEPFAYGVCIVLMGLVFATALWRLEITTLADLFRRRYSPGVERLAALVMIPTSLLWSAAQMRAFGQVIASTSELDIGAAVSFAALLVVVYTGFGGFLADALTDMVQGVCLLIGLVATVIGVLTSLGPGALDAIDPALVRPLPPETGALDLAEAWAVPVLGSVVAQELVARISASRSPGVARGSSIVAGVIYVLVGLIPVTLGLMGARLVPGLTHPEEVLSTLARAQLGPILFVLFAGALVSAILSTVDSTLLVSSSLLTHNVILPLRGATSERTKVRMARAGVFGFGVLAWLLALQAEGVHALVEQASSLGSSGVLVIMVCGLFTTVGGAASAYGAVIGGLVVYVAASYGGFPWPYLLSLAAALVGYALPLLRRRNA